MAEHRNPRRGGQRSRRSSSPQRSAPKGWKTQFPLSKDTTRFVQQHQSDEQIQNLGLWLDRFAAWRDWDDKGRDSDLKATPAAMRRDSVVLEQKDGLLCWQGEPSLLKGVTERWSQILLTYQHRGVFVATPAWRFTFSKASSNGSSGTPSATWPNSWMKRRQAS